MNKEKILIVDDSTSILMGYRRQLRKDYDVETANSGSSGLKILKSEGPFAVVVSDLRMPGMDGLEFLGKVKEIFPDTSRILLTGHATLDNAILAINEGQLFRILIKPCKISTFSEAITAGERQYHLITAEKEILEKTLGGSIKVLVELLSLTHPRLFERSMKMKDLIRQLSLSGAFPFSWELEAAAILSQIGVMTLPKSIINKISKGIQLEAEEKKIMARHPQAAARLLKNIPRLDRVAQIITYQDKRYDGSGSPQNSVKGPEIPHEARIFKIIGDLACMESKAISLEKAFETMRNSNGSYDPELLDKIADCFINKEAIEDPSLDECTAISLDDLKPGQILMSDIVSMEGTILVPDGTRITQAQLESLKNHEIDFNSNIVVKNEDAFAPC